MSLLFISPWSEKEIKEIIANHTLLFRKIYIFSFTTGFTQWHIKTDHSTNCKIEKSFELLQGLLKDHRKNNYTRISRGCAYEKCAPCPCKFSPVNKTLLMHTNFLYVMIKVTPRIHHYLR